MTLQMITANRLTDGAVVFLAGGECWAERFEDGALARDEAEAGLLQQIAEAAVARAEVVGPYLIEVSEQDLLLATTQVQAMRQTKHPAVKMGFA